MSGNITRLRTVVKDAIPATWTSTSEGTRSSTDSTAVRIRASSSPVMKRRGASAESATSSSTPQCVDLPDLRIHLGLQHDHRRATVFGQEEVAVERIRPRPGFQVGEGLGRLGPLLEEIADLEPLLVAERLPHVPEAGHLDDKRDLFLERAMDVAEQREESGVEDGRARLHRHGDDAVASEGVLKGLVLDPDRVDGMEELVVRRLEMEVLDLGPEPP